MSSRSSLGGGAGSDGFGTMRWSLSRPWASSLKGSLKAFDFGLVRWKSSLRDVDAVDGRAS